MPQFCRHNRLRANCPICSREQAAPVPPPRLRSASSKSKPGARSSARPGPSPRRRGDVRVRREVRGPQDDFASPLLPGVRSSIDAGRLAGEIAFAAGRLETLAADPPGPYGEAASAPDREEGLWLLFLIAYLSPAEGPDPWAGISAVRDGRPACGPDVPLGPRTAHDPARGDATLAAYRAWGERAGGLAAAWASEASWTPARRFARLWERLALPGLHRAARFDLLVTAGRLGLADVAADALHLGGADPATSAAKRAFGIGDALLLDRRAAALAEACAVPLEALDLALWNWEIPGRAHLGLPGAASSAPVQAQAQAALGL